MDEFSRFAIGGVQLRWGVGGFVVLLSTGQSKTL